MACTVLASRGVILQVGRSMHTACRATLQHQLLDMVPGTYNVVVALTACTPLLAYESGGNSTRPGHQGAQTVSYVSPLPRVQGPPAQRTMGQLECQTATEQLILQTILQLSGIERSRHEVSGDILRAHTRKVEQLHA